MRIASSIFSLSLLSSTFLLASSTLVEGRDVANAVIKEERVLKSGKSDKQSDKDKDKDKDKKKKKKNKKVKKVKKNNNDRKVATAPPTSSPTEAPTTSPTTSGTTFAPTASDSSTSTTFEPTGFPTGHPTVFTGLSDGALRQPRVIEVVSGEQITLTLKKADHSTVAATAFTTRLIEGELPGPTLKLKRGINLKVKLVNDLPNREECQTIENGYACPDLTNIHYHGGHVSGNEPSDDVYLKIKPGDFYEYDTDFPENHMPGTHWIHPHVHGATTIQVGGGAAQAFIVEDDESFIPLPKEVREAKDVLLVIQDFKIGEGQFQTALTATNDTLVDIQPVEEVGNAFRLVNGQYRPKLVVVPGSWTRMRILYAGWDATLLDFWIDSDDCDVFLLAKDGVYITDYPRTIKKAHTPAGGRADIMVRCNKEGTFTARHFPATDENPDTEPIMTIISRLPAGETEIKIAEGPSDDFTFVRPDYLTDLQAAEVEDACSCGTKFSKPGDVPRYAVNGVAFSKNSYIHTMGFGKVVERAISNSAAHPYHQHVYPFQISAGFDNTNATQTQDGYLKTGDWHDTLMTNFVKAISMKYQVNVHLGKIMMHCHRLDHEDQGMMSQELVQDGAECTCDFAFNDGDPFIVEI